RDGRTRRGVRLLGAVGVLAGPGVSVDRPEGAPGSALRSVPGSAFRTALGETAWETETAIGRAMTLDEAVEYALRPAPPEAPAGAPAATPSGVARSTRDGVGMEPTVFPGQRRPVGLPGRPALPARAGAHLPHVSLTARELEVAALIARGLTNPQIAHELIITTGTARSHVEHILGKLGLHSRTQVATWAAGRGLAEPAAG
ncbi:MAG TPA: LuxR C-terminal-related transcriptional regulator, partial [Chloroflexota bacterium]|nr:LuxR C-terminal-related transcriptional regulator [Chloroflexota bacterium]